MQTGSKIRNRGWVKGKEDQGFIGANIERSNGSSCRKLWLFGALSMADGDEGGRVTSGETSGGDNL